ncbi:MAG: hypothetical protein WCX16_02305 [Candidatus Omnitrophota bacterium]
MMSLMRECAVARIAPASRWVEHAIEVFFSTSFFFIAFFLFTFSLINPSFVEFLADIVSVFATATSYHIKTLFFLFYALILFFVAEQGIVRKVPRFVKAPQSIFLIIFLLAFLNIFLHFYFLHVYELPFSVKAKYWIFVNGGIGDVTAFYHSHSLKAVWYCLASLFGIKGFFARIDLQNIDAGGLFIGAGYPFLSIFPLAVYLVAALLYVVLFFFFLIALTSKMTLWGRRAVLFLPLYAMSSFSLLSNLIDGGPLTKEFLLSLAALIFFLNYDPVKKPISYRKSFFWIFFLATGAYCFYKFFVAEPGQKYFLLLLLYGIPTLTTFLFRNSIRAWVFFSLFIWMAVASLSYFQNGYLLKDDIKFYNIKLHPGEKVWITGYKQELPLRIVFQHGSIMVYEEIVKKICTLRTYANDRGVDYRSSMSQVTPIKLQEFFREGKENGFISYKGFVKIRSKSSIPSGDISYPFWKVKIAESTVPGFSHSFVFLNHRNVRHLNFYILYEFLRELLKTDEMVIVLPSD